MRKRSIRFWKLTHLSTIWVPYHQRSIFSQQPLPQILQYQCSISASLCLFFVQVILALFRFLNLCSSPCFAYVLLDLFCFNSLYVFLALYFRLCSCSSWSCFVMWVLCFGTWFWWEMTKLIIIIKYDCPFNCVFFYFRVFMYLFRTDVYFVHCFFCLKEVIS